MVTAETIKHLALLSRLELSGAELEKYQSELEKILEYVGELQNVDTAGVEPLHNVLGLTGALREDGERMLRDERLAGRLLGMAPKKKDGFVAVPRILYHEDE